MPARAPLTTRSSTTSTVSSDNLNKGSGLTNAELDSNFINLRDQTIGIVGDDSTGIDVKAGDTIRFTGAGGATVTASGDTITITAGGGGGASTGDITFVGSELLSPSNADITLTAGGTGNVNLNADTVRVGDAGTNAVITTNGAGDLILSTNDNTSSANIRIYDGNPGLIELTSFGGANINLNPGVGYVALGSGTAQPGGITTQLTYDLHLTTNNGTESACITVENNAGAGTGNIHLNPYGAGDYVYIGSGGQDGNGIARLRGRVGLYLTEDNNDQAINMQFEGGMKIDTNESGQLYIDAGTRYEEKSYSISGSSIVIDCAKTTHSYVTLSANVDIRFSNVTYGTVHRVFLKQNSGGNRTATFSLEDSTAIKFAGGPPVLSTAANTVDMVEIYGTAGWIVGGAIIETLGVFTKDIKNTYGDVDIVSYDNNDIRLLPDGTGNIILDNHTWPNTDGTTGQVLSTNGAGVLSWVSSASTATTFVGDDSTGTAVSPGETFKFAGTQNISTAVSGDTLTITGPDLTSYVTASSTTTFTNKSGNISQWTNNSGYLTEIVNDATPQLGGNLDVLTRQITTSTTNGSISIQPNGYGRVILDIHTWPDVDGTAGQVLTTDGAGVLSWTTVSGGGSGTITFVGDDSTGTQVNLGETFKIAGANGVTTAVSGDTLTVTGSGSQLTFVGDDSTGTTVSLNETFKIAGTGGITTSVTGDTLTVDGSGITGGGADLGNLQVNDTTLSPITTNDNVRIEANGVGRAVLGDNTVETGYASEYTNTGAMHTAQMNHRNTAWNATIEAYPVPLMRTSYSQLNSSTTTTGSIRMIDAVELNTDGFNWNFSPNFSGGPQTQNIVVIKNTSDSNASTLENAIGSYNKIELAGSGNQSSTLTVNSAFGEKIQLTANQDSGDTANIGTNYGLHYASPANFGSGTLNVTNEYGLYIDMSSSTATNNDAIRITGNPDHGVYFTGTSSNSYGFRTDSNAPNNRIGGIQFQFNRAKFSSASTPSTVSTLSWLYSRSTGPSGSQELYVKTGDGIETLVAPHNASSQWEFTAPVALVASSDPSTETDTAHIYAKDDAASAEVYVRDEAGNVTKISPHNAQGEWEYYSVNKNTGKTVRVNMEKMIRKLEEITGETFIENE